VGEQVAIEGGVICEEAVQPKLPLGRDELVEPDRARRDLGPLLHRLAMFGVRLAVLYRLENQPSLPPWSGEPANETARSPKRSGPPRAGRPCQPTDPTP